MVFSASIYSATTRYGQVSTYFFTRQILFMVIGFGIFFFLLTIPTALHRRFTVIYAFVIIGMLFMVYLGGDSVGGASRWIDVGPFRLQPSEFGKIVIVLLIARDFYLRSYNKKRKYTQFFVLFSAILLLTYIQPDNGSAIIMIFVFMSLFIINYFKYEKAFQTFVLFFLGLFAFLFFAFYIFSNFYEMFAQSNSHIFTRFIAWVNPFADYADKGYQLSNSLIAIGRGGIFGVGIPNGVQKLGHLPDVHTDFIVANIAEELGLVGVMVVIICYVLLLWRGFRIGIEAKNTFDRNVAIGFSILFFMQSMWNLAGISGLFPMKGLTAPFLSYGGSSIFMMFILFGIISRIHIQNNTKKAEVHSDAPRKNDRVQRKSTANTRDKNLRRGPAKLSK